MKKFLILIMLFMIALGSMANLTPPKAYISEIYVDSLGNWTLEMGFYEWDLIEIDSIMLETSSGSSIITYFTTLPVSGHFDSLSVITNENLANPVSIIPEGDYVKLISYAWGFSSFDYVAFGNYTGSQLDCIREGESVIFLSYVQSSGPALDFCIDISPTIGEQNDTTGALGTYSGMVWDLSGNPFTEGFFPIPGAHNTVIFIQSDGSFSERICSRRFTFDTIDIRIPPWPWTHEIYTIEPVDFCLRPDSSYYQDIICTSLVMDIEDKENQSLNPVTVAPNPFSDKVTFYFDCNLSKDLTWFSIYSLDGKQLERIQLGQDQQRLDWQPTSEVSAGTYIYKLESARNAIRSGKFVKL